MKVLVIGGTGLVGKYLVSQLLEMGAKIYLVSRDISKIPASVIPVIADLRNPQWSLECKKVVHDVDVIIYAAYSTSSDICYDRRVNYDGLVEVLSAINTKKVIFYSSVGVFGTMPEAVEHTESSVKFYTTPYQKDKIDACDFLSNITSDIRVSILHLSIVYDVPCDRFDNYKTNLQYNWIVPDNVRNGMYNLVYSKDAATAAVLDIYRVGGLKLEEYIVNGEILSYCEFINTLEVCFGIDSGFRLPLFLSPLLRGPIRRLVQKFGVRFPVVIPEPKASLLNNAATFSSKKIKAELGWLPSVSLKEILRVYH